MAQRRLVAFARFGDPLSAEALVAFLAAHEIAAHVEGVDPLTIGLGGRVRVVLAEEDARRARWMLENAEVGESEAWLRATGELDPAEARRAFSAPPHGAPETLHVAKVVALALAAAIGVAAVLSR